MTLQERISTGEPFSLKRRDPAGGTKPMKGWGFRNETDPLSDVLLGSPAFLRHMATSSLSRKFLRENPCNLQVAQAQQGVAQGLHVEGLGVGSDRLGPAARVVGARPSSLPA